ncbi:MAG: carboxypeptidase regulatory-like domain-containing protein [Armatimonadetes bacterium]|nr:carboxypeptidase regulatory-like domain-containing protein [Armatimonadota bacterium]
MRRLATCLAALAFLTAYGCGGGGTATGGSGVPAASFGRMTNDTTTTGSTGAISGTATSSTGQPVPGASVTVSAAGAAGRQAGTGRPSFTTQANVNGGFSIGNMPPGHYALELDFEGVGEDNSEVEVHAGQVAHLGEHHMRPRPGEGEGGGIFNGGPGIDVGVIVGTVKEESNNPIADARLSIDEVAHAISGPLGSYAFRPLRPDTYTVRCRAVGFDDAELEATVQAGLPTQLDFVLKLGTSSIPTVDPATVTGTVTDADTSEPLAGVSVHLEDGRAETTTDDLGQFSFTHVRPGMHVLKVEADGYRPYVQPLMCPPGSTIDVPVQLHAKPADETRKGTLHVVVTDAADGSPLHAAVVIGDHRPFYTDDNGEVTVENVPVGDHNLVVMARRYEAVRQVVTIVADPTTDVGVQLTAHVGAEPPEHGGEHG